MSEEEEVINSLSNKSKKLNLDDLKAEKKKTKKRMLKELFEASYNEESPPSPKKLKSILKQPIKTKYSFENLLKSIKPDKRKELSYLEDSFSNALSSTKILENETSNLKQSKSSLSEKLSSHFSEDKSNSTNKQIKSIDGNTSAKMIASKKEKLKADSEEKNDQKSVNKITNHKKSSNSIVSNDTKSLTKKRKNENDFEENMKAKFTMSKESDSIPSSDSESMETCNENNVKMLKSLMDRIAKKHSDSETKLHNSKLSSINDKYSDTSTLNSVLNDSNMSLNNESNSSKNNVKQVKKLKNSENSNSRSNVSVESNIGNYNKLEIFLQNNPNLKEIVKETNFVLSHLNKNEELWLMQCPKNIPSSLFVGKKINFAPDNTFHLKIDGVKYQYTPQINSDECKLCLLASKSQKNTSLTSKLVKPTGYLIFHQTLNQNISEIKVPVTANVKLPSDLKVRHPIFGKNFKDKIALKETVINKLLDAEINLNRNDQKLERKKRKKLLDVQKFKEEKTKEVDAKNEMIFQLLNLKKKKPKKDIQLDLSFEQKKSKDLKSNSFSEDNELHNVATKKKKSKKLKLELTDEFINKSSNSLSENYEENSSIEKKKSKKSKSKTVDESDNKFSNYFLENNEEQNVPLEKKKSKKLKSKAVDNPENDTSNSFSEKHEKQIKSMEKKQFKKSKSEILNQSVDKSFENQKNSKHLNSFTENLDNEKETHKTEGIKIKNEKRKKYNISFEKINRKSTDESNKLFTENQNKSDNELQLNINTNLKGKKKRKYSEANHNKNVEECHKVTKQLNELIDTLKQKNEKSNISHIKQEKGTPNRKNKFDFDAKRKIKKENMNDEDFTI